MALCSFCKHWTSHLTAEIDYFLPDQRKACYAYTKIKTERNYFPVLLLFSADTYCLRHNKHSRFTLNLMVFVLFCTFINY